MNSPHVSQRRCAVHELGHAASLFEFSPVVEKVRIGNMEDHFLVECLVSHMISELLTSAPPNLLPATVVSVAVGGIVAERLIYEGMGRDKFLNWYSWDRAGALTTANSALDIEDIPYLLVSDITEAVEHAADCVERFFTPQLRAHLDDIAKNMHELEVGHGISLERSDWWPERHLNG